MGNLTIQIGQGENKTINFKIETNQFSATDKLLFAVKAEGISRKHLIAVESSIDDLPLSNGIYTFTVVITSELSRCLAVRTYSYDLTLIDQYGQLKPLMEPADFIVNKTVGASVKREES